MCSVSSDHITRGADGECSYKDMDKKPSPQMLNEKGLPKQAVNSHGYIKLSCLCFFFFLVQIMVIPSKCVVEFTFVGVNS